jgi:hypothetical protein
MSDDVLPSTPPAPPPPRLLDQLREAARRRGHPEPAVAAFADWSRRYILFHGKRHPRELGLPEVVQFLESVARTEKDPVPALAASRDALDFLYREVLYLDLGELPWPRPPPWPSAPTAGAWPAPDRTTASGSGMPAIRARTLTAEPTDSPRHPATGNDTARRG